MNCPNGHGILSHEGNKDVCSVCGYSFVVPKKKANKHIEKTNQTIRQLWMEYKIGMDKREKNLPYIRLDKRNYDSGKEYRGINRWITAMYPDISFLTKESIEKHGCSTSESTPLVIVTWIIPRLTKAEKMLSQDKQDAILRGKRPFMVTHDVYPSNSIEGLPEKEYKEDKNTKTFESVDSFIESTGISIVEGGNNTFYDNDTDSIVIPRHQQYNDTDSYYRDVFRQLSKATGIKKRLNRDAKKFQKDVKHGRENLIAEFASVYMCSKFNIKPDMRVIQELDDWFTALDNDPYLLVSATQQAEKIFDYFFKK